MGTAAGGSQQGYNTATVCFGGFLLSKGDFLRFQVGFHAVLHPIHP